tara:strand:+ start:115 stop:891 length:777 start_codon:yes stop_codon:yes gene_type:complete
MKNELNVALIQTNLVWEQPKVNREQIESYFKMVSKQADVVFLPEMFSSGFTMNPESISESMNGTTVDWMKKWSIKIDAAIAGSLAIKEDGKFYNRFIWVNTDGSIHYYNKKHLFTLAEEHRTYIEGDSNGIIEFKGWKVCLRVCYDLRFPVWSRNTEDYDLLVYVANWPSPRINAWDILLQARAIENMSYIVGVNRIGKDALKNNYPGHSAAYDFLGACIGAMGTGAGIVEVCLNSKDQEKTRKQLDFLKDQDSFLLH